MIITQSHESRAAVENTYSFDNNIKKESFSQTPEFSYKIKI